ncbi:maleylpyruvate isomerase N-terminal domain-containing protein [Streptomyces sp. ST2-7A]|uniref:maleylpyruvate isomerase N-terminal domain-containing protein n=1 Tax=Streptomyces sp. ST2-7A TaxID=2907214 RepID=UPI001F4049FD|nr:maleylpyruvate isomerase N-terminal domain-containing protein [Streptomyces sp. ST2-7A]MCE7082080.1 maleylpyruvate isomerase N-terminal domain-containing protein [Streptomyces sp. ST2-7A]
MRGDDVRGALEDAETFLRRHTDREWSELPVPGLDFTVASVIRHVTDVLLWYALDLAGGPGDDIAFDNSVRADATPPALVASLGAAGRVCAAIIDAAGPEARGFHPSGTADPSGFAAMACDEILVHTRDAAAGLGEGSGEGIGFTIAPDLARAVTARLFPWHEPTVDPVEGLLWANGRIDLPGRLRQEKWRWRCAPLAEWDGTAPGAR